MASLFFAGMDFVRELRRSETPLEVACTLYERYEMRTTCPAPNHFCNVLAREGFFSTNTPVVDVGCGPSPHLGASLLSHIGGREQEVFFIDRHPVWLATHSFFYQDEVKRIAEAEAFSIQEHWSHADAYSDRFGKPPFAGNALIIHGEMPLRTYGSRRLARPRTPEHMVAALGSLLDAKPSRVALYLREEHQDYPESPSRVLPALDHLGVPYRVHEGVASADFTPETGGYLVHIEP